MPIDTRVSLHKLEVFDAVVELGGVSRAADHLGVAQPVVSGHLRSLEQRVGASLFYREGRRLHLTEAGRAVHLWATDMLRRTRELSRDLDSVSDGLAGSVVVGTSMSIGSYVLPPLLAGFLRERPAVEVRIDIGAAAQSIAGTEAGENDFSVVVIEAATTNHGLVTEQIGAEELVLVAPPHGLPEDDSVTVDGLRSLPFIEAQKGTLRRTFIDQELARIGLPDRRVAAELGHPEAMKLLVGAGLGVSFLFRCAVSRELADGTLREVAIPDVHLVGPVFLVHRKDKLFSAVHRALIQDIRAHVGPVVQASPA
jgi:DNA-binding transcriptional LysR family regulator